MAKFNKKKDGDLPAVSTASLPDIVFMLLFFFMTVTTMKDSTLMVDNTLPNATEVKKLEKKDYTRQRDELQARLNLLHRLSQGGGSLAALARPLAKVNQLTSKALGLTGLDARALRAAQRPDG